MENNSVETRMICAICGSEAEYSADEGCWRHKGMPFQEGFKKQIFCGKYGYPIDVENG